MRNFIASLALALAIMGPASVPDSVTASAEPWVNASTGGGDLTTMAQGEFTHRCRGRMC